MQKKKIRLVKICCLVLVVVAAIHILIDEVVKRTTQDLEQAFLNLSTGVSDALDFGKMDASSFSIEVAYENGYISPIAYDTYTKTDLITLTYTDSSVVLESKVDFEGFCDNHMVTLSLSGTECSKVGGSLKLSTFSGSKLKK